MSSEIARAYMKMCFPLADALQLPLVVLTGSKPKIKMAADAGADSMVLETQFDDVKLLLPMAPKIVYSMLFPHQAGILVRVGIEHLYLYLAATNAPAGVMMHAILLDGSERLDLDTLIKEHESNSAMFDKIKIILKPAMVRHLIRHEFDSRWGVVYCGPDSLDKRRPKKSAEKPLGGHKKGKGRASVPKDKRRTARV